MRAELLCPYLHSIHPKLQPVPRQGKDWNPCSLKLYYDDLEREGEKRREKEKKIKARCGVYLGSPLPL
jgi:hypothetical protein